MPPFKTDYGSLSPHESVSEEDHNKAGAGLLPPRHKSTGLSLRGLLFSLFGGTLLLLIWLAYSSHVGGLHRHSVRPNSASDTSSSPEVERFYRHQLVDHFGGDTQETYAQRYFEDASFFQGPGHPIFVIVGGEGPIEQILYPWVSRELAKSFGALTVCVEHRFYGVSQPVDPAVATNADFHNLLHPRQALADAARFIQHLQKWWGCGPRGSPDYCPVITIGGSYPGFLSVLMRTVHSDVVDIGWGSSAPMYLYSHAVDDNAYFDKITSVAEAYSPGCPNAVRETLTDLQTMLSESDKTLEEEANALGVCTETIPDYIDNFDILQQEIIMIIAEHFAENNMSFYPPGPKTQLLQGCKIFQQHDLTPHEKVSAFLRMRKGFEKCFDLVSELPLGPAATISASDWSGVGGGHLGMIWDYQTCTLIPECSLSPESMFPPRKWTLEWLTDHCQRRFDYTPHLQDMVKEFGFDDFTQDSYIIFTNGYNDGWYALSVTENVTDTVLAFNFPNGAHHSDLTHFVTPDENTPDIVEGHKQVTALIKTWLADMKEHEADV